MNSLKPHLALLSVLALLNPYLALGYSQQPVLFQDNFSSLSNWQLVANTPPNEIKIDTSLGFNSPTSLLLDYKNGSDWVNLKHDLSTPATEVLARVYFYDNLQRLGTIFGAYGTSYVPGTTTQVSTALGVVNSLYSTHYAMRINTSTETKDTGVARTLGWHMFELIITSAGTYAKIDNELVSQIANGISSPIINTFQTDLAGVSFTSTWGLVGQAHYDELLVAAANTSTWQEQYLDLTETFYNTYKNTDFSKLFPTLGEDPSSNDLRSLLDTAGSFYLYGKYRHDPQAVNRAIQIFKDGVNAAKWNSISDWAKGVAMGQTTLTTYLMYPDLDSQTRINITNAIYSQAQKYLDPNYAYNNPLSGYIGDTKAEENGWHAYFLAEVVNYFPQVPNRDLLEAKARCFAYHTITRSNDPAYCGITTQTVYDDWHLENHNVTHPVYGLSAIHQLALGAKAYEQTGKPVPEEFKHNAVNLYTNFIQPRIDLNSFHLLNNPPVDWSGAHKSMFTGALAYDYIKQLGTDPGFTTDQLFSKRSIFYYHITSNWAPTSPTEIAAFLGSDGYNWFLNSIHGGELPESLDLLVHSYYPPPGDLNGDNHVNLIDLQAAISSLNIFTYHQVVANYGKQL